MWKHRELSTSISLSTHL